jgi:hypothetical protein
MTPKDTAQAEQLSLLSPEMAQALDKQLEDLERRGVIKVTWSNAQERRLFEMFAALVAWAFAAPVTVNRIGEGYGTELVRQHEADVVIERFIRVKRWVDELKRVSEEAQTTEEYRQAYAHLLGLRRSTEGRLTNWETLIILSECSLQAPLTKEATAEMMRCFAHCYGLEKYMMVMSDHFEPLRADDCELFRYYSRSRARFPEIDVAERQWIADFNAQARGYFDFSRRLAGQKPTLAAWEASRSSIPFL